MGGHTTAHLGKRVFIILKTGERFVDKLVEMKSKYYEFEERGRIYHYEIRSFSILRPKKELINTT